MFTMRKNHFKQALWRIVSGLLQVFQKWWKDTWHSSSGNNRLWQSGKNHMSHLRKILCAIRKSCTGKSRNDHWWIQRAFNDRMRKHAKENGMVQQILDAGKGTRIKKGETHLRKGKKVRLQEIINSNLRKRKNHK